MKLDLKTTRGGVLLVAALMLAATFGALVYATTAPVPVDVDTVIGPGSMVDGASYVIFKTPSGLTCAKNGTTGGIDWAGTNALTVIQSTLNNLPDNGMAFLKVGEYQLHGGNLSIPSNVTLMGESKYGSIITSSDQSYIRIQDHSNITLKNFKTTGDCQILIWSLHGIPVDNIWIEGISATLSDNMQSAFWTRAEEIPISNVTFKDCESVNSGTFGFILSGWYNMLLPPNPLSVNDNVTFINCRAINCGRYSQFNPSVTGFDCREIGFTKNVRLIDCYASGSWESGFHTELVLSTGGSITLINCVSENNGLNPTPLYGYGFMVTGNMRLVNCIAKNNAHPGFYVLNNHQTEQSTLIDCVDIGSSGGFSLTYGSGTVFLDGCISYNASHNAFSIGGRYTRTVLTDCKAFNANTPLYAASCANLSVQLESYGSTSALYPNGSHIVFGSGNSSYFIKNGTLDIKFYSATYAGDQVITTGGKNITITGSIDTFVEKAIVVEGAASEGILIKNMDIKMHGGISAISNVVNFSHVVVENTRINAVNGTLLYGVYQVIVGLNVYLDGSFTSPYFATHYFSQCGLSDLLESGNTTLTVGHQVEITSFNGAPVVVITPYDNLGNRTFWVTDITSSSFIIHISASDGTYDHRFWWVISCGTFRV